MARDGFVPWEEDLINRSDQVRKQVHELERNASQDGRSLDVSGALAYLEELETQLLDGDEVSVALLGGTGHGKSTLLNALLGARIVPTSNIKACTSVITKARWSPDGAYRAIIRFVPRDSWTRQVERLAADIVGHQHPDDDHHIGDIGSIPRDENDRIRAVYGDAAAETFVRTGDLSCLVEPPSITAALNDGTQQFEEIDLQEFRSKIKNFLDSSDHYWPIVESVEIFGPFDVLARGGEIVDLPGLNDPNEAREETTRSYLETARFVWIAFNMRRNITKELAETLGSRDLLQRLLAGGRLSTLTLIGTQSDAIDHDTDSETLGLTDSATDHEIVEARNRASEVITREQLETLAQRIAAAGDDDDTAAEIRRSLVNSPIFMVSARDFLVLNGVTKGNPTITDQQLTNIPALREHYLRITTEAGPWAKAVRAFDQLEAAVSDLKRIVQQERTQFELSSKTEGAERAAIAHAVESAGDSFRETAEQSLTGIRGWLRAASEKFDKELKSGLDDAASSLNRVTSRWSTMHWATLRATSVRGGVYYSPTYGSIDLVKQIADPLIDRALAPWIAFFGNDLTGLLNNAYAQISNLVTAYGTALDELVRARPEIEDVAQNMIQPLLFEVASSVDNALNITRRKLAEQSNQDRQQLHRIAHENMARALAGAFARAGAESGTGMKARMITVLTEAVRQTSRTEYERIANILYSRIQKTITEADTELTETVSAMVKRTSEVSNGIHSVAMQPRQVDDQWIRYAEETVEGLTASVLERLEPPSSLLTKVADTPEDSVTGPALPVSTSTAARQLVLIDGANVCSKVGAGPDLRRLGTAIQEARQFWPEADVITVIDRKLGRFLRDRKETEQVALLDELLSGKDVLEPPPGHPGGADTFILAQASKHNACVVSNDSFKEWQHDYPWLHEEGRLFGHTYLENRGWVFTSRYAIRPARRS